jgi:HmuY protein
MTFHRRFRVLVMVIISLFISSCVNNDPSPVALVPIIYKNLNADYAPIELASSGSQTRPSQTNKFTFFSFLSGAIVARADSATTKWDIAFRGTTIIVNGGSSGKGLGKIQVVNGIFDELATTPTEGYAIDRQADNKKPYPASYAIQDETGKGWYIVDQSTKFVIPMPEKIIVVQTADGRYAKMQIVSYYQDSPNPVTTASKDRYLTFRYIYQPNGTLTF